MATTLTQKRLGDTRAYHSNLNLAHHAAMTSALLECASFLHGNACREAKRHQLDLLLIAEEGMDELTELLQQGASSESEYSLSYSKSLREKAETTEFRLGKEQFAIHYDQDGIRIGVCLIEHICDDEFPDIAKAMPTEKEDNITPAFNILYLAYFLRMFGDRYLHGVKFHYFGERRPCLVRFSRKCREDYGNPVFVLMPMIQELGEYPDE